LSAVAARVSTVVASAISFFNSGIGRGVVVTARPITSQRIGQPCARASREMPVGARLKRSPISASVTVPSR